ncbi:MAG: 2-C-methyl-D-erythritol 4-phosphate cytidylyltransferase [Candidatus Anoxychlamydiales bacterium]|nr:2-C-methyl-D-erythritol 4-phosphate cytidylyltransferase [Candidatus Anoxychlamydiales bacterium]
MKKKFISLIFLSGGVGSRIDSTIPKQYIKIHGKPIALYSFETFLKIDLIDEIIVVCNDKYKNIFKTNKKLKFSSPGSRRQDSVYNALLMIDNLSDYVCIHDAARPFIDRESIIKTIDAAIEYNASALGHLAANTIKKLDKNKTVKETLDRSFLFEIQTPQVIQTSLLKKGYEYINKNKINVFDDLSIIESLNTKIKIIEGKKENFKITHPIDLKFAKYLLNEK